MLANEVTINVDVLYSFKKHKNRIESLSNPNADAPHVVNWNPAPALPGACVCGFCACTRGNSPVGAIHHRKALVI